MSEDDIINVYINSKNREINETSSKFIVKIPENLLRLQPTEYFSLNVSGFYCFNTWFNCLDSFNNEFQLVIRDISNNITYVHSYKLNSGNPSVLDVKTNLNTLMINKVVVTYDKLKNKFIYRRTLPVTNTNYKVFLKINNAEDFLGFHKNERYTEIELPYNISIYSSYVVNCLGDEAITINIAGDCLLKGNTVDNFGTSDYQPSNILFMKPIDVASNELLKYSNEDGGDNFHYRLANLEQVTWFELTVRNQDNELIPDFSEYLLLLQFIKHRKENTVETILLTILDYTKQIYLLISSVLFPAYK